MEMNIFLILEERASFYRWPLSVPTAFCNIFCSSKTLSFLEEMDIRKTSALYKGGNKNKNSQIFLPCKFIYTLTLQEKSNIKDNEFQIHTLIVRDQV